MKMVAKLTLEQIFPAYVLRFPSESEMSFLFVAKIKQIVFNEKKLL